MKSINYVFIAILLFASISSCKKGDTGPMGATGPTGPTGNANVQVLTFTIDSASWVADSANLQWSADYTLASWVNVSGGVFLYVQDGSNWAALPHVDYGTTYEFGYDPATRIVEVQSVDATAMHMFPKPGTLTFRVVAILPAARKANPNVDFKNYSSVKQVFNLNN